MNDSDQNTDIFTAIADPTRRAMLIRLAQQGERSVTELMQPFSISQPAISKHLRILRDAGLVRSHKDGRERIYSLEASRLRDVFDWVSHFEKFWDDKLDALGEYLDRKSARKKKY